MMRSHKNPFINQYINYQPIFLNCNQTFQADVDKEELSIIDCKWNYKFEKENMNISSEWKLVELVGYTGEKVTFFEKRDIFAKRMICKINLDSNNKIQIEQIFDENVLKVFGEYNGPKLFYGKIYSDPNNYSTQFNTNKQKQIIDWNEIKNNNDFIDCYSNFTEIKSRIESQSRFLKTNTQQVSPQKNEEEQLQTISSAQFQQTPFELYHDALLRMEVTSWRMQDVVFFEFTKTLRDYEQILQMEVEKIIPRNPEIQQKFLDYYHGFVKTFSICFTEAQVIVSGKFDYDKGSSELNVATKLISLIPLVGDVASSTFKSIGEFVMDMNIKKNAKSFLNFAYDHTDLSQKCGYLALLIIKKSKLKLLEKAEFGYIDIYKEQFNQKVVTQNPSFIQKTKKQLQSIGQDVNKFLFGELYKGEYEQLGNSDATQLIEIICKGLQLDENDPKNEFERIKKDLNYQFKNDLKQRYTISKENMKNSCKCQIF